MKRTNKSLNNRKSESDGVRKMPRFQLVSFILTCQRRDSDSNLSFNVLDACMNIGLKVSIYTCAYDAAAVVKHE